MSGLEPLQKELDDTKGVVQGKMKSVQRLKLIGAVVAGLSGLVMAVTTAMDIREVWDKVVAALFASVGGLVVIFSDYFQTAPNGRRIASAEEYGKLSQVAAELTKLEARVKRHDLIPLGDEEVKQMIGSMDNYAAYVNELRVN